MSSASRPHPSGFPSKSDDFLVNNMVISYFPHAGVLRLSCTFYLLVQVRMQSASWHWNRLRVPPRVLPLSPHQQCLPFHPLPSVSFCGCLCVPSGGCVPRSLAIASLARSCGPHVLVCPWRACVSGTLSPLQGCEEMRTHAQSCLSQALW